MSEEALKHLGQVLHMLADLHPDDRCDALDNAMDFHNEQMPNHKVVPSDTGYMRLIDDSIICRMRDELELWHSSRPAMPSELTDQQADIALAATAKFLDIKGSQLTVNREKMKARYRALVKFIEASGG